MFELILKAKSIIFESN